jgi:hypothetical protein
MKKKHLYLKAVDAYSIGVLARQVWKEEWNREVLSDLVRFAVFNLKLNSLTLRDPKTRLSISDVLTWLISSL